MLSDPSWWQFASCCHSVHVVMHWFHKRVRTFPCFYVCSIQYTTVFKHFSMIHFNFWCWLRVDIGEGMCFLPNWIWHGVFPRRRNFFKKYLGSGWTGSYWRQDVIDLSDDRQTDWALTIDNLWSAKFPRSYPLPFGRATQKPYFCNWTPPTTTFLQSYKKTGDALDVFSLVPAMKWSD